MNSPISSTFTSDSAVTRPLTGLDVHAHYLPDFYREALAEAGQLQPDGIRALPAWDVQTALTTMDQLGVATALLSISSPGVHFGNDEKAQQLARRVNEEGKRVADAHSGRFGYFASLPLPHIGGAVAEAIYALDALGADGVVLESNSHGLYLGDPKLEPLYAELNKRSAVIFVHPTTPAGSCCERLAANYPQPVMEFIFDTTRSITDMIFSGVLERHPNVRVIVPHAGAALAALCNRIELLMPALAAPTAKPRPSFLKTLRHLHFDLAGAPVPHLLGPLLQVADHDRLHYGSDYPFTSAAACDALAYRIETTPLIDDSLRQKIWRDNTVALFPRLGSNLNKTCTD